MHKTAIFLGRFQPFHIGHLSVVEKIFSHDFDCLMLIIGSAEKSGTDENPWTMQEREKIIRASIPLELQERMDIVGLDDVPDDDVWCLNLLNLITNLASNTKYKIQNTKYLPILFTGNDWVKGICERHGIQTDWIDSYDIDISGTKIREMLREAYDRLDSSLKDMCDIYVVNEKAVEQNVRYIDFDMNRTAPGVPTSPDYELRRGAEIQDIIRSYDLVIDVHGTDSECGVCSIFTRWSDWHKKIIQILPWENHVIWQTEDEIQGPITKFHPRAFEIEVGPKTPENITLLSEYLGEFLHNYLRGTSDQRSKKVYKVVGSISREYPIPSKDFESFAVNDQTYFSFLTKNKYKENIGCILLKPVDVSTK